MLNKVGFLFGMLLFHFLVMGQVHTVVSGVHSYCMNVPRSLELKFIHSSLLLGRAKRI